ncbi:unnamed protein product [Ixodes persulcatus]
MAAYAREVLATTMASATTASATPPWTLWPWLRTCSWLRLRCWPWKRLRILGSDWLQCCCTSRQPHCGYSLPGRSCRCHLHRCSSSRSPPRCSSRHLRRCSSFH